MELRQSTAFECNTRMQVEQQSQDTIPYDQCDVFAIGMRDETGQGMIQIVEALQLAGCQGKAESAFKLIEIPLLIYSKTCRVQQVHQIWIQC